MNSWIKIKGTSIEIPLSDSEAHPISKHFSSASIEDFDVGVQRDFSKEITIEGSRVAMEYFNSIINWGEDVDNYVGTRKIGVVLVINGEAVMEGMMMILDAVKTGYETTFKVRVFSREIYFLKEAENVKLSALDYSDIDPFIFNYHNIITSWNNPNDKYFFALVDKGLPMWAPREFSVRSFAMYFYVKYLFEKVCNHFGVEIDSDLMEDDFFSNLVFGYGGGDDKELSAGQSANLFLEADLFRVREFVQGYGVPVSGYFENQVGAVNLINVVSNIINNPSNQVYEGQIYLAFSGTVRFHLQGEVSISTLSGTFNNTGNNNTRNDLIIEIRQDLEIVKTIVRSGFNVTRTATSLIYDFNQTHEIPDLVSGSHIWVAVRIVNSDDHEANPRFYMNERVGVKLTSDIPNFTMQNINTGLYEGLDVEFNRFTPDMSCSDFFKGIVKTLGIEYYIKDGVLYMDYFNKFYKNKELAKDWDPKLDEEQDITFSVIQSQQSKKINLKFEAPEDADFKNYLNITGNNFGDRSELNSSYFATGKTDIEVPFAPVALVKYKDIAGYNNLYLPRFVEDDGGVAKPAKSAPRLAFRLDVPIVSPIENNRATIRRDDNSIMDLKNYTTISEFKEGVGTALFQLPQFVYHDYPMPSKNFLHFHRDRLDSFLSEGARLLTASFRLKSNDISKFTRRDLVKVRGSYWRVVEIPDVDLRREAVVKVTLIKSLRPRAVGFTYPIYDAPVFVAPEVGQLNWGDSTWIGTAQLDGRGQAIVLLPEYLHYAQALNVVVTVTNGDDIDVIQVNLTISEKDLIIENALYANQEVTVSVIKIR